ncbi:MAG: chromate transporter [Thermoanaerobaculia bacterium]|jgi:chromate transporter|nr:chromate transporter [Thermoanaerobaculia bacterium]
MMPPTLLRFILYFLRLGALGFGGPVALTNAMRRDLVESRGWLTPDEFENGLALAAACPGPLAYQLGIYCGYIRFGIIGGLAVAVAFGLPPFIIVTTAAWLYVRFAADWHLRALFYGIAPAIVALIINACWNLGRRTLRTDRLAWTFAIVACAITVIVQKELAVMFIAAGLLGALLFAPAPKPRMNAMLLFVPGPTMKLFFFFFKTGLLVFGSGLVIVPFLKTQVVDQYHWLTNRQFLDSVAIGMISPGPVVITATFVGYLLNGFRGAVAATVGIFSAPILFTVIATPILLRYHKHPRLSGFIRGVGVTVVGVLVGTSYLVAQQAIGDWVTAMIAIVSLLIVTMAKKVPEPAIIVAAGVVGLLAYRALGY